MTHNATDVVTVGTNLLVLDIIRVYRRANSDQLAHACQVPTSTMRGILAREVKKGRLAKIPAPELTNGCAYHLTRAGARAAGATNAKWTRPGTFTLRKQRELFATFEYCFETLREKDGKVVVGQGVRQKLLRPQLEVIYPECARLLPNNAIVVYSSQDDRLETITVPHAIPDNIARKDRLRFYTRYEAFEYEGQGRDRGKKVFTLRQFIDAGKLVDIQLVANRHVERAILARLEEHMKYLRAAVDGARENCRKKDAQLRRTSAPEDREALSEASRARSRAERQRNTFATLLSQLKIAVLPQLDEVF